MKNHVVFVACGLFFAFPFSLYPQGTDRDLSLSISLNKSAGIAGEPFVAYIEITNICAHEKKNLPAITGDGDVQDTLFLVLIKTDASGSKEKDITCRQIPPSRLQYQLVNLRPGEKMTASVTIADKYPITEAGIYKIKCYYKVEKNLFGSAGGNLVTEYWKGTLSSEDVSLTIELPQSDVDKRVLRTILRSDGTSDLTWLQSRLLSGEKATAELKHKGIDDCVKSTYAKYAIALFLGNERMVTLRPDSAGIWGQPLIS